MSVPPYARISSGRPAVSTLITSAPNSASSFPAYGPAHTLVSSTTRTPSNGPPRGVPGGLSCGDLILNRVRGPRTSARTSAVCCPRAGAEHVISAGEQLILYGTVG